MSTTDEKSETITITESQLAYCSMFASLTPSQRQEFLDLAEVETFTAGETILQEGHETRNLWIIFEGECEVLKSTGDDEQQRLASLEQGAVFGEMSFFNPAPHSATVKAVTDVTVLRMSRERYSELEISGLRPAHRIAYETAVVMADRLRKMDHWVSGLLADDVHPQKQEEWSEFRAKLYTHWEF
ncbi:cyclic nucleotide-binding domain-containing protein [Calycomorphotria hydatis]|uniref:cAMP receptor protein n=1 Tax=Calycomorphotria hydatis TaxID=2528027 RepID=A0A517TD07_9PLAN|nr:cyclic nucleotide-binding domain-containing protein [Calycomorphotria hydatis]QDT66261.1 cAMP receptor protein [Calycomorphotria hydatis]